MVRFFGKQKKGAEDAAPPSRTSLSPKPAAVTPPSTDNSPENPTEKPPRRRTTARTPRPPRRDWAASAAATPVESPSPAPGSQATSPSTEESTDPASQAKRRRGTRGGRGRKKPLNGNPEGVLETVPLPRRSQEPMTIESAVMQQAATLEAFAQDVGSTLRGLQSAVADLQHQIAQRPPTVVTSHPRVGIFVDVPNVIYAAERRNVTLDFGRVLTYFTRDRELVRATAYAPISDDPQAKLESQRFAHHFIGHPYRLVTKPLKRFADGSMKANFDIELAVDILTMSDRLDVVVLMSGDGDFRRVVELIASRGVRVEVVAFGETASTELKTVADLYIDIGAQLEEFRAQK